MGEGSRWVHVSGAWDEWWGRECRNISAGMHRTKPCAITGLWSLGPEGHWEPVKCRLPVWGGFSWAGIHLRGKQGVSMPQGLSTSCTGILKKPLCAAFSCLWLSLRNKKKSNKVLRAGHWELADLCEVVHLLLLERQAVIFPEAVWGQCGVSQDIIILEISSFPLLTGSEWSIHRCFSPSWQSWSTTAFYFSNSYIHIISKWENHWILKLERISKIIQTAPRWIVVLDH